MAFIEAQSETGQVRESGLTSGAKQAIVFAMEEAFRLNHSSIGTEHVLLGLLRNGRGSCAGVITAVGIDVDTLRDRTFSVIETWDAEGVQAPAMRADHTRRHSLKLRGLRFALEAARKAGDEAELQSIERDIARIELRWLDAERDRLLKRLIDLERQRLSGDDEIRRVLAQIDWVRSQRRRFVDNRASRTPGPVGAQKTGHELEDDEPEDRR
jgi:ATP-dependent Clp protease ATP-binding subunit ClpA